VILPIPVGPAIGLSGSFSYAPALGQLLYALKSDENVPSPAPALTVYGGTVRVYPNHQARGIYFAGGYNQLWTEGLPVRNGYTTRVGVRNDAKFLYTGLEYGIGLFDYVDTTDFDEDSEGGFIPLIVPTFALSIGLAPF
jgi:hypothetical protein